MALESTYASLRSRLRRGSALSYLEEEVRDELLCATVSRAFGGDDKPSLRSALDLLETSFGMIFCELAVRYENALNIPEIRRPDQRSNERRFEYHINAQLDLAHSDDEFVLLRERGTLVSEIISLEWERAFDHATMVANKYFYGAPDGSSPFRGNFAPALDEDFDYPNYGAIFDVQWLMNAFASQTLKQSKNTLVPLSLRSDQDGFSSRLRKISKGANENAAR